MNFLNSMREKKIFLLHLCVLMIQYHRVVVLVDAFKTSTPFSPSLRGVSLQHTVNDTKKQIMKQGGDLIQKSERVSSSRSMSVNMGEEGEENKSSSSSSISMQTARNKGKSSAVLSYYLLWSPTIFRKMLIVIATIFAFQYLSGNLLSEPIRQLIDNMYNLQAQNRFLQLIVLPLLSSACCGIQLLINFLVGAGGCAGFNKHLGPLRPYFLGILLSTLSFPSAFKLTRTRFIQLFLAFLPEIVHGWNSISRRVLLLKKNKNNNKQSDGNESSKSIDSSLSSKLLTYQAEFEIPGMGCVACINKINNALRQDSSVLDSEAWLEDKGGRARIQYKVENESEAKATAQSLVKAVNDAGFDPCTFDNLSIIQ